MFRGAGVEIGQLYAVLVHIILYIKYWHFEHTELWRPDEVITSSAGKIISILKLIRQMKLTSESHEQNHKCICMYNA